MRLHLESFTDAGLHVIFDPAALPSDFNNDTMEKVTEQVEQGNILIYDPCSDGSLVFRFYVGENAESDVLANARGRVQGALLRVPSGRLLASGAEYLSPSEGEHKAADAATIPPGNYLVEAFEVDWDEAEIEAVKMGLLGPRAYHTEQVVGTISGCGLMVLILSLFGTFFAWLESGWEKAQFVLIYITLPGMVALCIGLLFFGFTSGGKRVGDANLALRKAYPGAVLILHRLPADTDLSLLRGGKFGLRYFG